MTVYGYEEDSNKLLKMESVCFYGTLCELEKVADFFEKTLEKCKEDKEVCQEYYHDWDKEWSEGFPDIIIRVEEKTS